MVVSTSGMLSANLHSVGCRVHITVAIGQNWVSSGLHQKRCIGNSLSRPFVVCLKLVVWVCVTGRGSHACCQQ